MFTPIVAASIIPAYCLWMRRHTWKQPWETGATVAVACIFLNLLLLAPGTSSLISEPLHAITGLWNAKDLIAHIVYLIALTTLTSTLVSRLTIVDTSRFLRRHIELPMTLALPALVGVFFLARPPHNYRDFFSAPSSLRLTCYWFTLTAIAGYLFVNLLWVLWVIRQDDPRSRTTVDIYIAGVVLNILCIVSILVSQTSEAYPDWVSWLLLCVAAWCYTIAPALSWRQKTKPCARARC